MRGTTTLMIAHRLSTVRHATVIVVLDNVSEICVCPGVIDVSPDRVFPLQGRIVEAGDHNTLMKNPSGAYAKLIEAQEVRSGPVSPSSHTQTKNVFA